MAEPLYIDGTLLGNQSPGINDRYKKIINYQIVKPSFHNDSYLFKFNQSDGEYSDDSSIFFRKRLGFNVMQVYEWNEDETVMEIINDPLIFTDCVFLDGVRYMFCVSEDYTQMKIFKQIYATDITPCSNDNDTPVSAGYFVNIAKYTYQDTNTGTDVTLRYFPFNKCLYDKFTVADFAKGKVKDSGVDGHIRNALVGLNIQTYFYDTAKNIGGAVGDFVMLYDGTRATQVNVISVNPSPNGTVTNAALMQDPFAGFYNLSAVTQTTTTTGSSTSIISTTTSPQTLEDSTTHKWKVFSDYGDILSFTTSDGIMFLHYSNLKPSESEFSYEGSTYYNTNNNANISPFIISGMSFTNSSILFLNNKGGTLWSGLQGYQKFYFDRRNSYVFGRDYTDVEVLSGYALMLGPNKISLVSPEQASNGVVSFKGFIDIEQTVGYWNKGSRNIDSGILYIYTSNKNLKKFTLQTFGNSIVPKIEYEKLYYQSDFSVLRRGIDNVYVRVEEGDIKMFLTDGRDTKVHLKDSRQNVWYKWLLDNVSIRDYKYNTWYGDRIYDHTGDQDKGHYYKTLMQYFQGGDSSINTKMYYHLKFSIGYNSNITKNKTFVKHSLNLGGRYYQFTYDDLWRTDYVYNIMKLRKTGNTDLEFKNYPIGIVLKSGNGFGYTTPQIRTFKDEFLEREDYKLVNDTDSNEKTEFTMAKYGIVEMPLSVVGETYSAEFVTYDDNALEFGGVILSYENMDIDQTRMENVATVHDFKLNGMDNEPLTHDSGTDNDIGV